MKGSTGKLLRIDLGKEEVVRDDLEEGLVTRYIGGSGLAAYLFYKEADPQADPLSPQNPLMFINGPLTGTNFPGSGRSCVAALSPLTGLWGECNVGGAFGAALKLAGYDGIVFTGKADKPLFLWVDGDQVDAGERRVSDVWTP